MNTKPLDLVALHTFCALGLDQLHRVEGSINSNPEARVIHSWYLEKVFCFGSDSTGAKTAGGIKSVSACTNSLRQIFGLGPTTKHKRMYARIKFGAVDIWAVNIWAVNI